jgi:hypothetical protein
MYTLLMVFVGLSSTIHDVVVEMEVEPVTLQLHLVFLSTFLPSFVCEAKHIPLETIYEDACYATEPLVPSFFSPIINSTQIH